jgi:antitoxin CptB
MRELDVLLGRYLDRRYPTASDTEKRAFEAVLDLPDPELFGYLVSGEPVLDEALRVVLDQIRTQS